MLGCSFPSVTERMALSCLGGKLMQLLLSVPYKGIKGVFFFNLFLFFGVTPGGHDSLSVNVSQV